MKYLGEYYSNCRQHKGKREVILQEPFNPIMLNTILNKKTKKKEPRVVYTPYAFNYGMIPQTWENSDIIDPETKLYGDNDPLDICELGKKTMQVGNVCRVRILGSFCVSDQGEMDWKILAINSEEAESRRIQNLKAYQELLPGFIEEMMEWFRVYKTYEGKRENTIMFGGKIFELDHTLKLIQSSHKEYKKLMSSNKWKHKDYWCSSNQ